MTERAGKIASIGGICVNECILVVDDDPEIVRAIAILLEKEGYQVLKAYNGMEALEQAINPALRLIIIDVMMPRLDGLSAVMKIREKRNLPIIVLSAKSEDSDKVLGLSMGADDYIAKPFHPQELVARVRSQLRRYTQLGDVNAQSQGGEIVNGRLCYRPEERVLLVDGEPVKLTATELKIVDLLMRNLGRVFPAEEIYRRVWNEEAYATENTVMVHIRRIREKIELNPKEPEYLKVVWGIGYKIEKR
nr:response regulator transcription factor [Flavonifractor plautii]